jgi:citrate lyase subunit beta/citryl-CoA lyase
MNKALESGADAVILDLEDSVALSAKPEARKLVAGVIDAVAAQHKTGTGIFVRTNAPATGMLDDDLRAIVRAGLEVIFLPKAETVEEVRNCAAMLDRCEAASGMKAGTVEICLMIESALGVRNCYDLIKASPRVTATCIGSARDGDLQTDLGCAWSPEGTELLYAKSKVLCDTRAAGAYPLDGVFGDITDEAALIKDSTMSARLGFLGRTPIHPKQITPVRQAYAVPQAEVLWYTRHSGGRQAGGLRDVSTRQTRAGAGCARQTLGCIPYCHGFLVYPRSGSTAQPFANLAARGVSCAIRCPV